jgi:K(+)-stimulated pyrophosphate-energized sodium pump
VLASLLLMRHIGKMSAGGPKAQEVGNAIREGAYAFLKRQYKTIGIITVVVFVLLYSYGQRNQSERSHGCSSKKRR